MIYNYVYVNTNKHVLGVGLLQILYIVFDCIQIIYLDRIISIHHLNSNYLLG